MLRGKDVQEIEELKRQGLSIRAISRLTGYDRKTISRYLIHPEGVPVHGPRAKQPGKLDAFQRYLQERMRLECGTREFCCGSCGSGATLADTRC
jgi:transposase